MLLYPEDRPLSSKTYAANDTVELYCPWCATSLSHGNRAERIFSFSYHDFLVVWSRVIEATRLGDIIQPLVPYMARHSGPSIDAALATRTRMEIKDRGRWKSDRSVLLHRLPAAYQAYALKCENCVAQGDFGLHSHQQCSNASRSVFQFLPRRPRGACFVVVSSGAYKSWTKNSAAWFPCWLVLSQFRINASSPEPFRCSHWPCARCSSLSILCLLVTLSRFTSGSKML